MVTKYVRYYISKVAAAIGRHKVRTALAMLAVLLLALCGWPRPPLYVTVVQPVVEEGIAPEIGDAIRLRLKAELGVYRDTWSLGQGEVDGDLATVAKAAGADELVTVVIGRDPYDSGLLTIQVSRRGADGKGRKKLVTVADNPDSPGLTANAAAETACDALRTLFLWRWSGRSPQGDYARLASINRAMRETSDYTKALDELEKLREDGDAPVEAYASEVSILRYFYEATTPRNPEYLERAREVLAAGPDIPLMWLAESEIEVAVGNTGMARELIEKAEKLIPDHPSLWSYKVGVLNLDEAIETARGARNSLQRLEVLSWLETKAGYTDEAREHLKAIQDMMPGRPSVLHADFEFLYGDSKAAQELYAQLADKQPQDHRVNYSALLILDGEYQEAIAICEMIIAEGSKDPWAFLNLGNAYELSGKRSIAVEMYERVVRESNMPTAKAQAMAHLGRYEDALFILQPSLTGHVTPEVAYAAAVVYAVAGNAQKAKEYSKIAGSLAKRWFQLPWFKDVGVSVYTEGVREAIQPVQGLAYRLRKHINDVPEQRLAALKISKDIETGKSAAAARTICSLIATASRAGIQKNMLIGAVIVSVMSVCMNLFQWLKRRKERIESGNNRERALAYAEACHNRDLKRLRATYEGTIVRYGMESLRLKDERKKAITEARYLGAEIEAGKRLVEKASESFIDVAELIGSIDKEGYAMANLLRGLQSLEKICMGQETEPLPQRD